MRERRTQAGPEALNHESILRSGERPPKLSRRQGLALAKATVVALCGLFALSIVNSTDQGLPVTDTANFDQLDDANIAAGVADVDILNGEAVARFNGNLRVVQASSAALPQDRQLSFALNRAYNSANVRLFSVLDGATQKQFLTGRSWVGLGWISHLGRIFRNNTKRIDPSTGIATWRGDTFFEFPDGSLYRFEPTVIPAQPGLEIKYYKDCVNFNPPPPCNICDKIPEATCCTETDECLDRAPDNLVEHYDVKFPGGTVYRLEKLIDYQTVSAGAPYIKNHDRAGYYTTKITDLYGNSINVEYYKSSNPNYPEAIKKISSGRHSDMAIDTSVCIASDPNPDQCPTGSEGLLKEARTTGFQGSRSVPQVTKFEFYYQFASVTDFDGTLPRPVLVRVRLAGSNGEDGGSILYDYGAQPSMGANPNTYGPLLGRITYPQGAVSEYQYGSWTSGGRENAPVPPGYRQATGVLSQATYPGGRNPDGSINGKPHYSWSWSRDLRPGQCPRNPDQDTFAFDDYSEVAPDGSQTSFTVSGDLCGSNGVDRGPFGAIQTRTIYSGGVRAVAAPLRVQNFGVDYPSSTLDPEREVRQVLGKSVETVYKDDVGACFTSTPTNGTNTTRVSALHRDGFNHWAMTIEGGDDYMPLLDGQPVSRVSYTRYLGFANTCWQTNRITDAYDQRFVEEGKALPTRYEEFATFNCFGDLTDATQKNEWQIATTDPLTGSPTAANHAMDADDLTQSAVLDATTGNVSTVTWSGGSGYPDGSSTNAYSTTYTWQRGTEATASPGGITYKTYDATIDVNGMVSATRDANGLQTSLDFDALGRPTLVDPPGSVEQSTRFVYPDLVHKRTLVSSGAEPDFDATSTDQQYAETLLDGLGRVIQVWRAMPNATKSTQITRYDAAGRVAFVSEWMPEADYTGASSTPTTNRTWVSGDLNGDGSSGDYSITGIPFRTGSDASPWGTTTFYGDPDPLDPANPLKAEPDGLGRPHRMMRADGSSVDYRYCGPHVQTTMHNVRTDVSGANQFSDVVTRKYYDSLGRLVVVDAPSGSANAVYAYDTRGNLSQVNLVGDADWPSDPYAAWRNGTMPTGQLRVFKYDAAGRLVSSRTPEKGTELGGSVNALGNPLAAYYDAGGNRLVYQDALAQQRHYFFKQTYDVRGRATKLERVRGDPSAPTPSDDSRLGADGDFPSTSGWAEGTITSDAFTATESYWKTVAYSSLSCIPPAPGQTSTSTALYFGNPTTCTYSDAPSGPQAIRHGLTGVTRDDVITFKLWRQVRSSGAQLDSFKAFVVLQSEGGSTAHARVLQQLDSTQDSFGKWQQSFDVRPGDLFTNGEWPEGATRDVYLYFVFQKGDINQSGVGAGVVVDDVFVGRRGTEEIAQYDYDVDECSGTPQAAGEACTGGDEGTNYFRDHVSQARSYNGGRLLARRYEVFKGLSGRQSGERTLLDWAGAGAFNDFVAKSTYSAQGLVASWTAPFQPGIDSSRRYEYTYRRTFLSGLVDSTNGVPFIVPPSGATSTNVTYSPGGSLTAVSYANGTTTSYALDGMDRAQSIRVVGPPNPGQTLWDSGQYKYDGAGNVTSIGTSPRQQQYAYDVARRLTRAQIFPQTTDPGQLTAYDVSYTYDPLGNMTTQQWQHSPGETPPPGMAYSLSYGAMASSITNQVQGDAAFAYDPNGAMTRAPSASAAPTAMLWDSVGRLTAFFNGTPEQQSRPTEKYAYDEQGFRLVQLRESQNGRPIITLRASNGRTTTEFSDDPTTGHPHFDRDNVFALGSLIADRHVTETFPVLGTNSTAYVSGNIGLQVSGVPASGTFLVDIRTAQGFENHVGGLVADANGVLWVPESALTSAEANWLRVRQEGSDLGAYSNPVTVAYDPAVTSQSANQVRAVSVARTGTSVSVRWQLLQDNGKKVRVYFHRTDSGTVALLTPQGLAPGTTVYTLPDQSLSSPCGYFSLTQSNSNGSGETGPSVGVDLPPSSPSAVIDTGQPGCGGVPGPPSGPSTTIIVNSFHHTDHLGSLRMVTDAAGWKVEAHDYYPFGREIGAATAALDAGGVSRFAGHERDSGTGLDYMVARYKSPNYGFFASPDLIEDEHVARPHSWNKYVYVLSNPLNEVDPMGGQGDLACIEIWDPGCDSPTGGYFWGGSGGSFGGVECTTIDVNGDPKTLCVPTPGDLSVAGGGTSHGASGSWDPPDHAKSDEPAECPGGEWGAPAIFGEGIVDVGPIANAGAIEFAGTLVCWSNPDISVPFITVCYLGGGLGQLDEPIGPHGKLWKGKVKGTAIAVGGGFGPAWVECSGITNRRGLASDEGGGFGQILAIWGFRDKPESGGSCWGGGVGPDVGLGGGAFECRTKVLKGTFGGD